MSTPSEIVERLRGCLSYRLDGPYIIVDNACGESIKLEAVEVRYYVTVRVEESVEEGPSSARREISERLSLGKRLPPGGSVDIYFGPVENIVEVYAVVDYGGGRYRVPLRMKRVEETGGEEKG